MAGLAGFVDYDVNGKPFIGLMVEDGTLSVKLYLGHRNNAPKTIGDLTQMMGNLLADLRKAPDHIVAADGVIDSGSLRIAPGGNGKRTG